MNANDIAQKGTPAAAIAAMLVLWLEWVIETIWIVDLGELLVTVTIAGLTPIIGFVIHKIASTGERTLARGR